MQVFLELSLQVAEAFFISPQTPNVLTKINQSELLAFHQRKQTFHLKNKRPDNNKNNNKKKTKSPSGSNFSAHLESYIKVKCHFKRSCTRNGTSLFGLTFTTTATAASSVSLLCCGWSADEHSSSYPNICLQCVN